jgi:Putative transposase/FtsX-like permease family
MVSSSSSGTSWSRANTFPCRTGRRRSRRTAARKSYFLRTLGRLRDGTSPEAAAEQVAAIERRLKAQYADYAASGRSFFAAPFAGEAVREVRPTLLALLGAVAIVLLLACVNIASLLVGRDLGRRGQMGVRAALGASRFRLIRQALVETLVPVGLGVASGLALGLLGLRVLMAMRPAGLARFDAVHLDPQVLVFRAAVGLTSEVGEVLERVVRRMERHLRRSGQLRTFEDEAEAGGESDPEGHLAASAVSGQAPPAGPQWVSRLAPPEPRALAYAKPLCASLDGFTLHAATRAGALDWAGREALLHYVLRPPVAQERVEQRPDGMVRITLKRAYRDGTVAVDMDPLSLLCRLATSVPPPRFHTVKYSGVLAPASPWRSRLAPPPPQAADASARPDRPAHAGTYRPWAELLARTYAVDVLVCPTCQGRMKLLGLVKAPASIARYLATVGEATEVPRRLPGRGPLFWKSRVLRRHVLGDEAEGAGRGHGAGEEVA